MATPAENPEWSPWKGFKTPINVPAIVTQSGLPQTEWARLRVFSYNKASGGSLSKSSTAGAKAAASWNDALGPPVQPLVQTLNAGPMQPGLGSLSVAWLRQDVHEKALQLIAHVATQAFAKGAEAVAVDMMQRVAGMPYDIPTDAPEGMPASVKGSGLSQPTGYLRAYWFVRWLPEQTGAFAMAKDTAKALKIGGTGFNWHKGPSWVQKYVGPAMAAIGGAMIGGALGGVAAGATGGAGSGLISGAAELGLGAVGAANPDLAPLLGGVAGGIGHGWDGVVGGSLSDTGAAGAAALGAAAEQSAAAAEQLLGPAAQSIGNALAGGGGVDWSELLKGLGGVAAGAVADNNPKYSGSIGAAAGMLGIPVPSGSGAGSSAYTPGIAPGAPPPPPAAGMAPPPPASAAAHWGIPIAIGVLALVLVLR